MLYLVDNMRIIFHVLTRTTTMVHVFDVSLSMRIVCDNFRSEFRLTLKIENWKI